MSATLIVRHTVADDAVRGVAPDRRVRPAFEVHTAQRVAIQSVRPTERQADVVDHHERLVAVGAASLQLRIQAHESLLFPLAVRVLKNDRRSFKASRCASGAPPARSSTRSSSGHDHPSPTPGATTRTRASSALSRRCRTGSLPAGPCPRRRIRTDSPGIGRGPGTARLRRSPAPTTAASQRHRRRFRRSSVAYRTLTLSSGVIAQAELRGIAAESLLHVVARHRLARPEGALHFRSGLDVHLRDIRGLPHLGAFDQSEPLRNRQPFVWRVVDTAGCAVERQRVRQQHGGQEETELHQKKSCKTSSI